MTIVLFKEASSQKLISIWGLLFSLEDANSIDPLAQGEALSLLALSAMDVIWFKKTFVSDNDVSALWRLPLLYLFCHFFMHENQSNHPWMWIRERHFIHSVDKKKRKTSSVDIDVEKSEGFGERRHDSCEYSCEYTDRMIEQENGSKIWESGWRKCTFCSCLLCHVYLEHYQDIQSCLHPEMDDCELHIRKAIKQPALCVFNVTDK